MPSWDYKCSRCGDVSTMTFRSAAERDRYELQPVVCGLYLPLTHEREVSGFCAGRLERQWPAPNFQLKGAGWTPKHFGGK